MKWRYAESGISDAPHSGSPDEKAADVATVVLVACASTTGAPPVFYQGFSHDILTEVARDCPKIHDIPDHAPLAVSSTTPTSVTCTARAVSNVPLGNGLEDTISVTFTAFENGSVTALTGSSPQGEGAVLDELFGLLDSEFQRITMQ